MTTKPWRDDPKVKEAKSALWRQLPQYRDAHDDAPFNDPYVHEALDALCEAVAAAHPDSARMDWLEANGATVEPYRPNHIDIVSWDIGAFATGKHDLRAAIDAARSVPEGKP